MVAYVVEALDDVSLAPGSPADGMDLMSPYVWMEGDTYRIMVRVLAWPLGEHDATGTIYCGKGSDGLCFTLRADPAIAPGPGENDAGGCEDPTVVRLDKDGGYAFHDESRVEVVEAARHAGTRAQFARDRVEQREDRASAVAERRGAVRVDPHRGIGS